MTCQLAHRAVAVAAVLVSLVSCTGEKSGTPIAADTTAAGASSDPTSRQRTATSTSGNPDLAALDPCSLLTAGEVAQLHLPPGKPETTAGNAVCEWNQQGSGIVDVTVRPNKGIDDLNTSGRTVTDVNIGAHKGRRLEGPEPGLCDVDIAVSEKSSVTVGAVHDQTPPACALAEQVANLIEPKLPRG